MIQDTNIITNPSIPRQSIVTFWKAKRSQEMTAGNYVFYNIKTLEDIIIEGYKAMADLNCQLAEEFLSVEVKDWPE